jgi:hypothetical protein
VAIAREQKARSFALQAALALAKLYQSTDRLVEAHAVLAPALGRFSPTPEMPVIAKAQELLAALAQDSAKNGLSDDKGMGPRQLRAIECNTDQGVARLESPPGVGCGRSACRAELLLSAERTNRNDRYRLDSGSSRGDPCKGAIRPFETIVIRSVADCPRRAALQDRPYERARSRKSGFWVRRRLRNSRLERRPD